MKKQLLSLLLALVLVLGLTVISAAATEEPTAPAHADHCVCGGKAVEVGDHVCETVTGWTPFSTDVLEATTNANQLNVPAGNYYLAEDITINKELNIRANTEVTLCMNGHTLTGTRRIFRVNGILNLCDCSADESGVIDGKSSNGPVFYSYNSGDVRLYSGTLTSTYTGTKNWGGVCAVANDPGTEADPGSSSFTMYGGVIDASELTLKCDANGKHGNGGAIVIMGGEKKDSAGVTANHPCTFTMYGGTVKGAQRVGNAGAAIYCNSADTLNLLGGTITGGIADDFGNCVATGGKAAVVVGGNVNIEELSLNEGQTFTTQNLTGSVGLATFIGSTEVVTTVPQAELACFTSTMPARKLVSTETADGWAVSFAADHTAHCVCGGVGTVGDHTCTVQENWIGLSAESLDSFLVTSATNDCESVTSGAVTSCGNASYKMFSDDYDEAFFYLEEDITVTTPIEIHTGDNITICLNGYTLKKTGNTQLFRVWGTLNICDCTGEGVMTSNSTGEGGMMYLLNTRGTALVNIFGGTLQMTDTSYASKSGFVQVGNNGIYDATLNIYGGTITGGKAFNGGNIFIEAGANKIGNSTVNMYGGTVQNGIAKKNGTSGAGAGGNFYVNGKSVLNIYGGTVKGGTATEGGGGNIYMLGTSQLNIYGGTITDGTSAQGSGGNICAFGKACITLNNGTIKDGTATAGMGGNINLGDGTQFVMYNGSVTGGAAAKQGGNICANQNRASDANTQCTIYGGTITGGTNTGTTADAYGADIAGTANNSGPNVVLDGKVVIGEIGMNGQKVENYALGLGENFATDTPIKIAAKYIENGDGKGMVIKNITEEMLANFVPADPTQEFMFKDDDVFLRSIYYFCRCGGNVNPQVLVDSEHTCTNISFTPVDQAYIDNLIENGTVQNDSLAKGDCVVLPAGNYILVEDVTVTMPVLVASSTTVNLNLNGNDFIGNTGASKYTLLARGALRVSDSSYAYGAEAPEMGRIIGGGQVSGSALYVCSTSTTFFFGGEIGASIEEATVGGPLAVSGTCHMEGGIVRGYKKTTSSGAAVVLFDGGTFVLWDGTVIGGEATLGGAIYTAKRDGYTQRVQIFGGLVTGGSARQYGGNIYVQQSFTMKGGVVENGKSLGESYSGGNICVAGATATISGGIVTGGEAKEGGNISIRAGGKLTVSGGEIKDGYARNHGGNIVAFNTLEVTGGEIHDGSARRGGNISTYANSGRITISGGKIYDGILYNVDEDEDGVDDKLPAQMYGANISMNAAQEGKIVYLTVTGGEIGGFGEGCVEGVSSVHIASAGEDVVTTLGGTAVIDQIRLGTGRMITIDEDGFQDGASIGVERFEVSGIFAPEVTQDYSAYFHGTEANTTIQAQQTENGYNLILVSSVPYYAFNEMNVPLGSANTIAEAMAIEGATFVRLVADYTSEETFVGDLYLDLCGNELFGLTVNGNLYLMDMAGNEFEEGVLGGFYGTATIVPYFTNSDSYINNTYSYFVAEDAEEAGLYRAHRVEVVLTHVSLKANADALGYRAEVHGDSVVLANITAYGFNMSIKNNYVKTYKNSGAPADATFTLRLSGIMAADGGEMQIIGQPFVCFGEDTATGDEYTTTMKQTILAVNKLTSLTDTQKEAVYGLYEQYKAVMDTWFGTATNNIATWAPVVEEPEVPETSEPTTDGTDTTV